MADPVDSANSVQSTEDPEEQYLVDIPLPVLPEHLVTGSYANRATYILGDDEVFIDFSMISPRLVILAEDEFGPIVEHTIVSRVVMPIRGFERVIESYVTKNPDLLPRLVRAVKKESTDE